MAQKFVKVPVRLIFNRNLTMGARHAYGILSHLAYESGRRSPDDWIDLGALKDLADAIPCSQQAVRKYIKELEAAGWLEKSRGGKRGRRSLYRIHDTPRDGSKIIPRDEADGKEIIHLDKGDTRARDPLTELHEDERSKDLSSTDLLDTPVPALVKIDGQNAALNALLDVCGIASRSPRIGEGIAALNGTPKTGDGIRKMFWQYAIERGGQAAIDKARDDREAFELGLAVEIERRARMYRVALQGAFLSPGALQKYWIDLPRLVNERPTTDIASRLAQEADRLEGEGR